MSKYQKNPRIVVNIGITIPPHPVNPSTSYALIDELIRASQALLQYAEQQTCQHEETHRGGAIWEICDLCGAKWADDRGGKPPFIEPTPITKLRNALDAMVGKPL